MFSDLMICSSMLKFGCVHWLNTDRLQMVITNDAVYANLESFKEKCRHYTYANTRPRYRKTSNEPPPPPPISPPPPLVHSHIYGTSMADAHLCRTWSKGPQGAYWRFYSTLFCLEQGGTWNTWRRTKTCVARSTLSTNALQN